MASVQLKAVVRHLHRLSAARHNRGRTDGELLQDFVDRNDQDAFAALVRRHGPLVFGVCRRELGSAEDAEDAFQATFLLLAQKAGSIRKQQSLSSWLHGVAYRMAQNAKRVAGRRRKHEGQIVPKQPVAPGGEADWREVQAVLDEEVQRLPEACRAPFVLCFLEGLGRAEAAAQLGLTGKALEGRLARARALLRTRLARRGVSLSAVLAAAALTSGARAAAPGVLVSCTLEGVRVLAAGGAVPAKVAALTDGVLKSMMLTKIKIVMAVLLLGAAVVALGGSSLPNWIRAEAQDVKLAPAAAQKPAEQGEGKPADDREKIQGTWDLVSFVVDGKEKPKAEKGKQQRFIFTEDRLFMKEGDRVSLDFQTYQVDQELRTIDLDRVERPGEKMLLGIYLLEGDTLKICVGLKERPPERPTQFVSKLGSETVLLVLKRSAVAEKIDKDWARAQEEFAVAHAVVAKSLIAIHVALFKYAEDRGHLPPAATYNREGKPLLSWRVAILPYLGQDDLYRQFKLEEPWDSEHNKKLLAQMPQVYAPVGVRTKEDHVTFYQVFTGPGTAFEGKEGIKQDDFPDGPNDTILFVKGGEAVAWTKPADLPLDAGKPLPKLGTLFEGGFYLMVAGSGQIWFARPGFDEKVLRAAMTRNGGESAYLQDLNKR